MLFLKFLIVLVLSFINLNAAIWSLTHMSGVISSVNSDVNSKMGILKNKISDMNSKYDNLVATQENRKKDNLDDIAKLEKEILITYKRILFDKERIMLIESKTCEQKKDNKLNEK